MYVCVPHMFGDHEGQKKASDFLKINLQKIVSCHVDAGPLQEPRSFARTLSLLNR